MTIRKYNSKGISHHLLLPVIAVLFIAAIGGYVMQRSSSAASVTKWTSIGTAGAGYPATKRLNFKVSACKLPATKTDYYKIKIKAVKDTVTLAKELRNDNDMFDISIRHEAKQTDIAQKRLKAWTFKSTTLTTAKSYPKSTKFSVEGWSEFVNAFGGGLGSKKVTISSITNCN